MCTWRLKYSPPTRGREGLTGQSGCSVTWLAMVFSLELIESSASPGNIVISNFKSYVLGTYHGVSGRYMQEYLDEFCYRLNQRFWENQIPNRLLKLCAHPSAGFSATCDLLIAILPNTPNYSITGNANKRDLDFYLLSLLPRNI